MSAAEEADAVRAFVALELEPRLHAALSDLQSRLRPTLRGCRLVRPQGIHLTLRFLGQTKPNAIERLHSSLAAAAAACPSTDARAALLSTFPERGSPRVLWLGLEVAPPVLALQQACERAARDLGFAPENRPFRAHLTLGRWRDRVPRPELPSVDLGKTRLATLTLFKSDLGPDGAVYTPLARFALGGEALD